MIRIRTGDDPIIGRLLFSSETGCNLNLAKQVLSGGLVDLPQQVIDPAALIAQDPCIQGQDSQFIATGRGGLPPNPRDLQSVNLSRVRPIETIPNNSTKNSEIDTQQFTERMGVAHASQTAPLGSLKPE